MPRKKSARIKKVREGNTKENDNVRKTSVKRKTSNTKSGKEKKLKSSRILKKDLEGTEITNTDKRISSAGEDNENSQSEVENQINEDSSEANSENLISEISTQNTKKNEDSSEANSENSISEISTQNTKESEKEEETSEQENAVENEEDSNIGTQADELNDNKQEKKDSEEEYVEKEQVKMMTDKSESAEEKEDEYEESSHKKKEEDEDGFEEESLSEESKKGSRTEGFDAEESCDSGSLENESDSQNNSSNESGSHSLEGCKDEQMQDSKGAQEEEYHVSNEEEVLQSRESYQESQIQPSLQQSQQQPIELRQETQQLDQQLNLEGIEQNKRMDYSSFPVVAVYDNQYGGQYDPAQSFNQAGSYGQNSQFQNYTMQEGNQYGQCEVGQNVEQYGNTDHNPFDQYVEKVGPSEYKAELVVPTDLTNDPSLNFVGMMIGPGGYTQKQMEQSTGCSITVRGIGSTRNSTPLDPDRHMYVLIKADHEHKVRAGVSIVSELLSNKAKRDMLRQQQLALRSAQLSTTAQNYTNPSYYMQQIVSTSQSYSTFPQAGISSNRTPFQNAFRQSKLGGGQVIESIIIPAVLLSLFTGPNHAQLDEITYYSGAKIDMKDVSNNQSLAEITLLGKSDQIAMARKKLQAVMANDPSDIQQPAADHIFVPNTVVGLIIGKNGETIKKFMSDTNCRMKVIPEFMTDPESTERKILLFGNPNQCANAKYIINDLVMRHKMSSYSSAGNANSRVEIVSVPCGCIGILIGKGGETIRSMGQRTNCRVQVVQYDENQLFPGGVVQNHDLRHVSLKGNEEALKKAKIEIQAIINEHAHRHGYEAPRMDYENGDQYLGLQPEQYEKYLEQMKAYCNMDKEQVHAYYRSVMSEIAKEPSEYAVQVKQHLQRAMQANAAYYQGATSGGGYNAYANSVGGVGGMGFENYGGQYNNADNAGGPMGGFAQYSQEQIGGYGQTGGGYN